VERTGEGRLEPRRRHPARICIGPITTTRLSGGLDAETASPVAWTHRVSGLPRSLRAMVPPPLQEWSSISMPSSRRLNRPTPSPTSTSDYVRVENRRVYATAFWRGVGATHNVFVVESFMDEASRMRRRQDPLAYSQGDDDQPAARPRRVDTRRAEKAGWGQGPCRQGEAAAFSVQFAFGSYLSQVRGGSRPGGTTGSNQGPPRRSAQWTAASWSTRTRSRRRSKAATLFGLTACAVRRDPQ